MLQDEIRPYMDCNGYVNPNIVSQTIARQCDNSVMFTSEYYIMIKRYTGVSDPTWVKLMAQTMPVEGLLTRYINDSGFEGPDDYYGFLSASKELGFPMLAKQMLQYGKRCLGFFNVENPGHIREKDGRLIWERFLWRQPQLIFATLCAANEYRWWKFWQWPLMVYTALVISTSCINAPTHDADSRRLSWHLIQATKHDSFLCRLASKLWWRRLYKQYNVSENGMQAVALNYYQMGHPFIRYWID